MSRRRREGAKPTWTSLTEEALAMVQEPLSFEQLCKTTGANHNQMSATLTHLERKKVVERVEEGDVSYWFLTGQDMRIFKQEERVPEEPGTRNRKEGYHQVKIQMTFERFYKFCDWLKTNAEDLEKDGPFTYGQLAELGTKALDFPISQHSVKQALESTELKDKLTGAKVVVKTVNGGADAQTKHDLLTLARHVDMLFSSSGRGHPLEITNLINRLIEEGKAAS